MEEAPQIPVRSKLPHLGRDAREPCCFAAFHDLRGRGFGLVKHEKSGYGHDFRGWEFYNQTKVMFGTVLIGGKEYKYPAPVSMKWRPDKVICTYKVAGVNIREEKFIADKVAQGTYGSRAEALDAGVELLRKHDHLCRPTHGKSSPIG